MSTTTPRVAISAADHPIVPNLDAARTRLWGTVPDMRVDRDDQGVITDMLALRMRCDLCHRSVRAETLTPISLTGHAVCSHCHEMHRSTDIRALFDLIQRSERIDDVLADDIPF